VLSGLVSHYRVVSTLGAGGMGVVHKAIDTRLNRPVAIKAIPEGLGLDTAAVLRLRAEAQSAASLDHPYICKIYELLDTDSGTLIVMEFVEGETLASMLLREGPLPFPNVTRYGAEIAEGLAAAHATGLIHRDIKPSNVMITPHNHVKLLDFGIAHNTAIASGTVTTESMQTRPGSAAGSPFYMAPEQALGRTVDGKTDVFSLGVVLFECLTGKLPFEGTTRDAYVLDMLTGRPRSVATLAPSVPATIADVVAGCLDRNPELRPDAASLAAYLRAEAPTGSTDRFFVPPRRSWKQMTLMVLAFVALAVPATWGIYRWLVPVEVPTLGKHEALITWPSEEFDPRLSPDGKWISFLSNRDGGIRLFVTSAASDVATPLTSTEHTPLTHVWSPDGTEIAALVRSGGETFVHVLSAPVGGVLHKSFAIKERPVFPSGGVRLLRWIGSSLYLATVSPELWRIDLQNNNREDLSKGWSLPAKPQDLDVSPDGRSIVFTGDGGGRVDVWIANIDGSSPRRLTDDPSTERQPVWARNGTTVVFQSTRSGQLDLWEIDVRTGRQWQLTSGQTEERFGEDTASGSLQVIHLLSENSNVWLHQDGVPDAQLTFEVLSDFAPTMAGGRIAFQRSQPSLPLGHRLLDARIWLGQLGANGSATGLQSIDLGFAPRLSGDGKWLAYLQMRTATDTPGLVLAVRDLQSGQTFTPLTSAAPVNFMAEPMGWSTQSAAWSSVTAEFYAGVRTDDGYSLYAVKPEALKPQLPPDARPVATRVLAKSGPREQLTDFFISPDERRLAYFRFDSSRTDLKVRKVELREIVLSSGEDRLLRTEPWPSGRSMYYRGWTQNGRGHIIVDQIRRSGPVRIFDVSGPEGGREIASVEGGIPGTARVDARRQLLYMTRTLDGLQNIVSVSMQTGEVRQVTSNRQQGAWFSDIEIRQDGAFLFALDRRSSDIWTVRRDGASR
jgi:serine/threonine protein kinase